MFLGKVAKIVDELDGEYKPSIIEKKEAEIYVQYELAIVEFENVFDNNADMEASDKLELAKTMKKIYARLEKMDKYKVMKDYIDNN